MLRLRGSGVRLTGDESRTLITIDVHKFSRNTSNCKRLTTAHDSQTRPRDPPALVASRPPPRGFSVFFSVQPHAHSTRARTGGAGRGRGRNWRVNQKIAHATHETHDGFDNDYVCKKTNEHMTTKMKTGYFGTALGKCVMRVLSAERCETRDF